MAAEYTKVFADTYPNGWQSKPSISTPYTVAIKNNEDATLRAIEDHLYNNPIGDISQASISDLVDVSSSIEPSDGQTLLWDEDIGKYVPSNMPMNFKDLTDVNFDTSGIAYQDVYLVKYDYTQQKFIRYKLPNLPTINVGSPQNRAVLACNWQGSIYQGWQDVVPGYINNALGTGSYGAVNEAYYADTGLPGSSSSYRYRDKIYTCSLLINNPTLDTLTDITSDLPNLYLGGYAGDTKYYFRCEAYIFVKTNSMDGYWIPMGARFDANDYFGVAVMQGTIKYFISGFSSIGTVNALKIILAYNKAT